MSGTGCQDRDEREEGVSACGCDAPVVTKGHGDDDDGAVEHLWQVRDIQLGLVSGVLLLAGFLATYIGVQWAVAINGILVLAYMPYLWLKTPMRSIE